AARAEEVSHRHTCDGHREHCWYDTSNVRDVRRKYVGAKPLRLWRHGIELKKQYEDVTDWRPQYQREVEDMRLAHRAGERLMIGADVGGIVGLYPGFSEIGRASCRERV